MDYDIIFADGRNAVTDHRTGGGGRPSSSGWRPFPGQPTSSRTVIVPPGARPTVITGSANGYYPPYYAPSGPFYNPSMPYGQPSFASRFGLTTGELIDSGVQLIAAILPLPGAPVAQGEAVTDIENSLLYQSALANHAKRDEQLRTLGTLLTRILR